MNDKVNVLLVDDQPAKLLAYETILADLGENLIKAASAREALQTLLKVDIAILLIDVCMPELDGFQLAAMIREHPRFQQTAIIFISAIHLTEQDRLRGFQMGAVDYVPVPVVPEVLRAKVKVFAELFRKTRELERLNLDLERRVAERTAELEASNLRLRESERRRTLALAAGKMGSWDVDLTTGACEWDAPQCRIFGVDPQQRPLTLDEARRLIHPEDLERIETIIYKGGGPDGFQTELRVQRPDGQTRWCICAAAMTANELGRNIRVSGVTIDITELKEAEARRMLLVREVDHRARNTLAVVQSVIRMTRAKSIQAYKSAVEGRISALSTAHSLLSESRWEGASLNRLIEEELAPYRLADADRVAIAGPAIILKPETAQVIALVVHEFATNAVKYGALSSPAGKVNLQWCLRQDHLELCWQESGGPPVQPPAARGFGTKVITASIENQLDGKVSLDWHPAGLSAVLTMRITPAAAATAAAPVTRPAASGPGKNGGVSQGACALLVEDEALVGMMMADLLDDLGLTVLGPLSSVDEARIGLHRQRPEVAILDVNVRGEMIYEFAHSLRQLGIPTIFVTGYSAEAIDGRFDDCPVLQKPVDREALRAALGRAGKPPTPAVDNPAMNAAARPGAS